MTEEKAKFSNEANAKCTTSKCTTGLTVSPVLKDVLALVELAGGVVSFTDAACIQRGLGAQNLVTSYFLSTEVAK